MKSLDSVWFCENKYRLISQTVETSPEKNPGIGNETHYEVKCSINNPGFNNKPQGTDSVFNIQKSLP